MIENSLTVPVMARVRDYYDLTKPRLTGLSLVSAAVGFFLASKGPFDYLLFLITMAGTGSIAAGAMTLNQWIERDVDACMQRTASRPLPSGRLQPVQALWFGLILCVFGLLVLLAGVNPYAAAIGLITVTSYLFIYTPLKRKTEYCTIVGAVPGALPPLIGWAAVSGKPSLEAWILFAIVFFWQMPHFFAIAWMLRKDYHDAGFRMLSVRDPGGKRVGRQMVIYTMLLFPVSLLPTAAGLTGGLYLTAAVILGAFFCRLSFSSVRQLDQKARSLFRASILYLTILFILMFIDKAA